MFRSRVHTCGVVGGWGREGWQSGRGEGECRKLRGVGKGPLLAARPTHGIAQGENLRLCKLLAVHQAFDALVPHILAPRVHFLGRGA